MNTSAMHAIDRRQLRLHDMNDVLARISFINGDSTRFAHLLQSDSIDYIAVYSWANFLPAQSGYMIRGVDASSGKKKNILVLSLNLDFNDKWATQAGVDEFNRVDELSFASK